MKISKIQVLVVGLALVLVAAAAVSETGHMHRHGMFGEMLPFHAVDLTDAQRAQIKQIYENGKPAMQPLFQQAHQNREAMIQLITSGNFDQAKAQALANQSAQLHAQIEVQHALLSSQAYQVLTSEQKAKMNEVLAKRQQWFEQHMQQKQTPEAPAEPNQ
jgi:periplasmic protein CpxP/Spy